MKPILLPTETVKDILNYRITCIQRPMYRQPDHAHALLGLSEDEKSIEFMCGCCSEGMCLDWSESVKLPYLPGDILYVRETWDAKPVTPDGEYCLNDVIYYRADGDLRPTAWGGNWRPSTSMPKKYARIFLRVTNVDVRQSKNGQWSWIIEFERISKEKALEE